MDDFFLIDENKNFLILCKSKIAEYLKVNLKLVLHPKKIYLQEVGKGVTFFGVMVKPYRRYPSFKTKGRIFKSLSFLNNKLSQMDRDLTKEELFEVQSVVNSYIGYMSHCNSYKLMKKMHRLFPYVFSI